MFGMSFTGRLPRSRERGTVKVKQRLACEKLEARRVLAGDLVLTGAPLQNQTHPLDVNNDGIFAAGDVAALILTLNTPPSGGEGEQSGDYLYTDINGDGHTSPGDALAAINYVNGGDDDYGSYYSGGGSSGSSGSLSFPSGNPILKVLEYEEFDLPLTAEGDFAYLTVEWLDPDGSPPEYWYPDQNIWHVYHDDFGLGTPFDDYGVVVRGFDWYGDEIASASSDIRVHNRLPSILSIDVNPTAMVEEGTAQIEIRYDDASWYDYVTVEVDWGDGSSPDTVTRPPNGFYSPGGYDGELVTFSHTFIDDEDDVPHLEYKVFPITVTVIDDDNGAVVGDTSVTVANADPKIKIDAITPIDVQGGTANQLDESERFTVDFTVTDLGRFDEHEGYIRADLNFDGDHDDPGEVIEIGGSGAEWSSSVTFDAVLDDGPFGATPGNYTLADVLPVEAYIEDDDGGKSGVIDFAIVNNVAPVFSGSPIVNFNYNSVDELESIEVVGSFNDMGIKDWHTVEVAWNDGEVTQETLDPGEFGFNLLRTFIPGFAEIEALFPILVSVEDDDRGLTLHSDSSTCGENTPTLPAWTDAKYQQFLATNPTPASGHRMLNWQTDFPRIYKPMHFGNRIYAYTDTFWVGRPDQIELQVRIVEERELPIDSYDSYESAAAAGAYWARYKELGKSSDDAFDIAESKLSGVVGDQGKCWMTVAKFDDASIDQWVRIALNPAGTYKTQLTDGLPPTRPQGGLSVSTILAHEQGHLDITEAFAKVLRAELKTMHATVYSPIPTGDNPSRFREAAAQLLRKQAQLRLVKLGLQMNAFQKRYDGGPNASSGSIPQLQDIIAREESDPNCIMEPPVFPFFPQSLADRSDVCGNGVIRTVQK